MIRFQAGGWGVHRCEGVERGLLVSESARGVSDFRWVVGAFIGARGLRGGYWRVKVGESCENLGGRLSFL